MKGIWRNTKLGEICEIELGKTPLRSNHTLWDPDRKTENVWLSIADLLNTTENKISTSREYISDKGASISKVVKAGTLLRIRPNQHTIDTIISTNQSLPIKRK